MYRLCVSALTLVIFIFAGASVISGEEEGSFKCNGKVMSPGGAPIEGASINIYRQVLDLNTNGYNVVHEVKTITKANGDFDISFKDDKMTGIFRFLVTASKEGRALKWKAWNSQITRTFDNDFVLGEPLTLSGIVSDESGAPISGAVVKGFFSLGSESFLLSVGALEYLSETTNTDGKFVFDMIPKDAMAAFIVTMEGRGDVMHPIPNPVGGKNALSIRAGTTDIKIAIPKSGAIKGKVVDKASGKHVAKMELLAEPKNVWTSFYIKQKAISGEDGSFLIKDLSEGDWNIKLATKPDDATMLCANQLVVTVESGATTENATLEIETGSILEAKVKDAGSGKALSGAYLIVDSQMGASQHHAMTNENGVARLTLPQMDIDYAIVFKESYEPNNVIDIPGLKKGKVTHINVELERAPAVAGVVLDEKNNPVQGVEIYIPYHGRVAAVSDRKGRFRFYPNNQDVSELTITARDQKKNLAAVKTVDNLAKPVIITLEKGIVIKGKVVDSIGEPLPEAELIVMQKEADDVTSWSVSSGNVYTDNTGCYEIQAIPRSRKTSIYATVNGYGRSFISVDTGAAKKDQLDVDEIVLAKADRSISGVVLDTDGKPVVGAQVITQVIFVDEGQPECVVITDSEGRFTMEGLCPGTVTVLALNTKLSMSTEITVQAGKQDIEIKLDEHRLLDSENIIQADYEPGEIEPLQEELEEIDEIIEPFPGGLEEILKKPITLIGKAIPAFEDLGVELVNYRIKSKIMVVCFWEMNQRSSRHCISTLNKIKEDLASKNIVFVCVDTSSESKLKALAWLKGQKIDFHHVGKVVGDNEKVLSKWGVDGYPWVIVTDASHVVRAQGIEIGEMEEVIRKIAKKN